VENAGYLFTLDANVPRPFTSTDFAGELAAKQWISQGPKAGLGAAELLFQVGDLMNVDDPYVHLLRITIDQVNELLANTSYDSSPYSSTQGPRYPTLTVATDVHGGHYHNVTLRYQTEDVTWFVDRVSTVPEGVVEGAEEGQDSITDVTGRCTVRPIGEPQTYIFQLFNAEGNPVRAGYDYYSPIVSFSFGAMLAKQAFYGGQFLLRSQYGISIRGGGSRKFPLQATLYYDSSRATFRLKNLVIVTGSHDNETSEYFDTHSLQLANSGDYGFRGMFRGEKSYLAGELLVRAGDLVLYNGSYEPDVVIHGRTLATGAIIMLVDTLDPDGNAETVTVTLDPDDQLKLANHPDEPVYAVSDSIYSDRMTGERKRLLVPFTRDVATNTLVIAGQLSLNPAQYWTPLKVTYSLAGVYATVRYPAPATTSPAAMVAALEAADWTSGVPVSGGDVGLPTDAPEGCKLLSNTYVYEYILDLANPKENGPALVWVRWLRSPAVVPPAPAPEPEPEPEPTPNDGEAQV
jgi:hypothetical protein